MKYVLAALAVIAAVWFQVVPSLAAWTSFFFSVQFSLWDTCFFGNTITSSLFLRAENMMLDRSSVKPLEYVAEMSAADYSYEKLRIMSDNFKEPVVVRGFYKDSPALRKWNPEYVSNLLGPYDVTVMQNSTLGKDHDLNCHEPWTEGVVFSQLETFEEAMADIKSGTTQKTIVLPPASRSERNFNTSLQTTFNEMLGDIDLKALGGAWYRGLANSALVQFWAGFGRGENQGTGWHADICNNFIVQVQGTKNWTFVHPRDSKFMRPTMKRGKTAISGVDMSIIEETLPYLTRKFVTIQPGDMMYNPDFYWHQVKNNPGFTMAVVARECNISASFAANPLFTTMIGLNHVRAAVGGGDSYARKRLVSILPGSMKSSLM